VAKIVFLFFIEFISSINAPRLRENELARFGAVANL
jgi:hypothetical protein